MARVSMADVVKFRDFLNAVLAANPTGEFETWDYEPWLERKAENTDLFGWEDEAEEEDNPPKWVRKDERKMFPNAKIIDDLVNKVSSTHRVKEMKNGTWYVVAG